MKKIALSQRQSALVDDADFERFGNLKWTAQWIPCTKSFSAIHTRPRDANGKKHRIILHREIMGNPAGKRVDHENHDTLDCQRHNLRVCTPSQNGMNRIAPNKNSKSGIRGVHFDTDRNKWRARIGIANKQKNLGYFANKIDAISAYAVANKKYFGAFGGLNQPQHASI